MPPWDPELYRQALHFAAHAHAGQRIPGTELPYTIHLSQVCQEAMAALFADHALNADLVMQCALLHDTIEDTHVCFEDLVSHFGLSVARGVDALTKRAHSPEGTLLTGKEAMRDSLKRIRSEAREVWVVKLADRITNLHQPPAHWTPEKVHAYHAQAIEIRDALGSASSLLNARLGQKIERYPRP